MFEAGARKWKSVGTAPNLLAQPFNTLKIHNVNLEGVERLGDYSENERCLRPINQILFPLICVYVLLLPQLCFSHYSRIDPRTPSFFFSSQRKSSNTLHTNYYEASFLSSYFFIIRNYRVFLRIGNILEAPRFVYPRFYSPS